MMMMSAPSFEIRKLDSNPILQSSQRPTRLYERPSISQNEYAIGSQFE